MQTLKQQEQEQQERKGMPRLPQSPPGQSIHTYACLGQTHWATVQEVVPVYVVAPWGVVPGVDFRAAVPVCSARVAGMRDPAHTV